MDSARAKSIRRKVLINMAKVEEKPSERCVIYDAITGAGVLFETWAERDKALDSGKYVRRPNQSGAHNSDNYEKLVEEDMIVAGIPFETSSSFELVEDDTNYAARTKLRDSNLPPLPKYVSTMNVEELKESAKKVGLNFDDEDTRPLKRDMIKMIKQKAIELGREDIK